MAGDSPVVREDPEVKLEGDERLGALETDVGEDEGDDVGEDVGEDGGEDEGGDGEVCVV